MDNFDNYECDGQMNIDDMLNNSAFESGFNTALDIIAKLDEERYCPAKKVCRYMNKKLGCAQCYVQRARIMRNS